MLEELRELKQAIGTQDSKEMGGEMLSNLIDGLTGSPASLIKLAKEVIKAPAFVQQQIFWIKFMEFLQGVYLSEDEAAHFVGKMMEDGKEQENTMRIIQCVDQCDSQTKIKYILSATHNWAFHHVDRTQYFRMIRQISTTPGEALTFVRQSDLTKQYSYTELVQDLVGSGVMYVSETTLGDGMRYAFAPSALMLDKFALSYHEMAKYRYDEAGVEVKLPVPDMKTHAMFG